MTQTKTEMQDAIAKMQVEIDELKRLHATLPDEPKPWPQDGDKVYYPTPNGDTDWTLYNSTIGYHERPLKQGSFKRTKEESQAVINFRMAYTKLDAMNGGFIPDWTDSKQEKWFPSYIRGKWTTQISFIEHYSQLPHFPTEEMLEKAIEAMGDDMDYLLESPV